MIVEGNVLDDLEVKIFEGIYRINGGYFVGGNEILLIMFMLGIVEIWNVFNIFGLKEESFILDFFFLEWYLFYIY